ncbi:MAG: MaoC family dehydratase [Pseudomonadota bacterium]
MTDPSIEDLSGTGITGRYFEEFQPGQRFKTAGATLTESMILDFAQQYDPQPFHIDVEAAKDTPFGGLIASGFQTLSMSFRLVWDTGLFRGTGLGSGGGEGVRWLHPVRPGDTLYVVLEVASVRPSKSSSERGTVVLNYTTRNQTGTAVMTVSFNHLIKRKKPETLVV